jgi:hypothetical protein
MEGDFGSSEIVPVKVVVVIVVLETIGGSHYDPMRHSLVRPALSPGADWFFPPLNSHGINTYPSQPHRA